MTNRYFKVDLGRYGAELTIGTVNKEFVEYWNDKPPEELVDHLQAVNWSDNSAEDTDSPPMIDDFDTSWSEVDDFEHLFAPAASGSYEVVEVEITPGAEFSCGELVWANPDEHRYSEDKYTELGESVRYDHENFLYGREAYTSEPTEDVLASLSEDQELCPVLVYASVEKGCFGEVVIQTTGSDFDPELFSVGTVETDLDELIETCWYDGAEVIINQDNISTDSRDTNVLVGYINPEWHGESTDFAADTELLRELLLDFYPA